MAAKMEIVPRKTLDEGLLSCVEVEDLMQSKEKCEGKEGGLLEGEAALQAFLRERVTQKGMCVQEGKTFLKNVVQTLALKKNERLRKGELIQLLDLTARKVSGPEDNEVELFEIIQNITERLDKRQREELMQLCRGLGQ